MNANVEFLNYIYQNSQMGVDTLEQLMDITEDEKLQAQLEKQLEGYRKFHSEAREILNRNGYDEKGLGTFEKIRTYLMVNLLSASVSACKCTHYRLFCYSILFGTSSSVALCQLQNSVVLLLSA